MTRYVRIGGDACWDNENFEIVRDVNTKQCSFFHSGIRFVNGDITQIKKGYLFCVSLKSVCLRISNPEYIGRDKFKVCVNNEYFIIVSPFCGHINGLYRILSGSGMPCMFYHGMPLHSMAVRLGVDKEPVFMANVCLYSLWALLLDDYYRIKAIVLYSEVSEDCIIVFKLLWSYDSQIYKKIMFGTGGYI